MKIVTLCGPAALAMAGCAGPSFQPDAHKGETAAAPAEHRAFIDEFSSLMKRHPGAAKRYRLADMGDEPITKHVIIWKCENIGEFGVDCVPQLLE